MKIVQFEGIYRRNETRDVIRKVIEVKSINSFILSKLHQVDFTKDDVIVEQGNKQIRIPEEVYKQLKDEVKTALFNESITPTVNESHDEEYIKTRYWTFCKAFIFNFHTFEINIGVKWGYEGAEGEREKIEFVVFEHPFIAEFISCSEGRWGEAGEKENIKKWLKTVGGKKRNEFLL
jgi:hypothetical protein